MSPDWRQPFVFIFEWGMLILGWGIVTILSVLALVVVFAVIRATYVTITRKRAPKVKEEVKDEKDVSESLKLLVEGIVKDIDTKPRSSGSFDDNPPKV